MVKLIHRKQCGFTMIEMLVATLILMSIITTATIAYRQFLQYWDGEVGHFYQTLNQIRKEDQFKAAVSAITPYVVYDQTGMPTYYFEGTENGFVAVTEKAVSQANVPAVIRVYSQQQDDFSHWLIYEEAPMQGWMLTKANQKFSYTYRIVLAKLQQNPLFEYKALEPEPDNIGDFAEGAIRNPIWYSAYNAISTKEAPQQINLVWGDGVQEIQWLVQLHPPAFTLGRYSDDGY
ncbi:PulJ/GspJ family protein [Vibrio rotiferianus]|uniref:PulJ/GspJ family protein n=1 Tax=Vibrio rotiferianus TaxID=190895 RepID=UPI000B59D1F6|nr:prepilin-type N-terminal cleavage/methylation domain-containing protein [Vibrio rotiferianus]ASI97591.1 hypothetical protein BSZ04_22205 [Vibrio rotiferianus]